MIDPITLGIGAGVGAVAIAKRDVTNYRQAELARRQLQLQRDEQLRYQRARLQLHSQIVQAVHDVGADVYRRQG